MLEGPLRDLEGLLRDSVRANDIAVIGDKCSEPTLDADTAVPINVGFRPTCGSLYISNFIHPPIVAMQRAAHQPGVNAGTAVVSLSL